MWKIDISYECYLECWKAKILQILFQNWARKGKIGLLCRYKDMNT